MPPSVSGVSGHDLLFGIENVIGTYGDDLLFGNGGVNVLTGGAGSDFLDGRGGADWYSYFYTADRAVTAPDRILDFSHSQGDKLDLHNIDANEQLDGNQAFQFIGNSAFTGPGQVHWYQSNGDTIVETNTTDLTAGPEMKIVLDPPMLSLQASDVLL